MKEKLGATRRAAHSVVLNILRRRVKILDEFFEDYGRRKGPIFFAGLPASPTFEAATSEFKAQAEREGSVYVRRQSSVDWTWHTTKGSFVLHVTTEGLIREWLELPSGEEFSFAEGDWKRNLEGYLDQARLVRKERVV